MTFAQRMVTSKEPTGENEIPGMAPAQKIIIVLALKPVAERALDAWRSRPAAMADQAVRA